MKVRVFWRIGSKKRLSAKISGLFPNIVLARALGERLAWRLVAAATIPPLLRGMFTATVIQTKLFGRSQILIWRADERGALSALRATSPLRWGSVTIQSYRRGLPQSGLSASQLPLGGSL